ncbi:MAG: glutamate-cysteine ligase family protein [Gemmatimonadales bacterium]
MTSLTRAALAADLATGAFGAPARASLTPRRIGAEAEFLPVETATGRRCPIEDDGLPATLPFLRRFGRRQGWTETRTAKGTPCFGLPDGGTLTFEPGGQLEYSAPPCPSPSALLGLLRSIVLPLRAAAAADGITLLAVGIDPYNVIDGAPLLLRTKRYQRMADYLATRGPTGAMMMRQTAAFQVALDLDDEPWQRWRVLNSAAPYTVAIFANSAVYAGKRTECASARAHVWRTLDPARTGLPWSASAPVEAYLDFALAAPALLRPTVDGEYLAFETWVERGEASAEDWHDHLTTLFPEVRPRGHFELRSADAVAPQWYAAPLALAVGIAYDPRALRAATDLLGAPDVELLERAGRAGLRDPALARTAGDLARIALEGCDALGPGYFHPADLEQARAFFDRYTWRGRCPADDVGSAEAAA